MTNITIIKRPVVSERASERREQGTYVFLVARRSTKNEVKKAIKELYGVDVTSVNMIVQKPKPRRYRGLPHDQRREKKAIVTVKAGQKIELGV